MATSGPLSLVLCRSVLVPKTERVYSRTSILEGCWVVLVLFLGSASSTAFLAGIVHWLLPKPRPSAERRYKSSKCLVQRVPQKRQPFALQSPRCGCLSEQPPS